MPLPRPSGSLKKLLDSAVIEETNKEVNKMDLIHYLFAPLILFRVPYTLNLLL